MKNNNKLEHLAIILDGNARWARLNDESVHYGHSQGALNAKNIAISSLKHNIKYLTYFIFSSENWQRPNQEIEHLFGIFLEYLKNETEEFQKNNVRVKFIGNHDKLSDEIKAQMQRTMKATEKNSKITLYLAISYGSRLEIVDACKKIVNQGVSAEDIDEKYFSQNLYDINMPDVDLLIRTGNSHRISNFLLWQSAYSELLFSEKYWPDFNEVDLAQAVEEYYSRKRSFGQRIE